MKECSVAAYKQINSDISPITRVPDSQALKEFRKIKKESQTRFWSRFGVTQTSGSRFELGKGIPPPIAILLRLYFDGIISDGDLWRAKRRPCRRKVAVNPAGYGIPATANQSIHAVAP